jgi:cyclomaltodextrinase / maltogenic alpha-amylase / neopullulanase
MMNLTASHDSPRFSTSIYNPGRYKYHNNPREDQAYRIERPDRRTARIQELILVQQFTYVGAPHVWNGDEVGMWGADDPDDRKPLVWADLEYEDETTHPFGRPRSRDRVVPDTALFRVYQRLISLRKRHLRLFVDGGLGWLRTDDAAGVLVYERVLGDQRAVIAFNVSGRPREFAVKATGTYREAYPKEGDATPAAGELKVRLDPGSAKVWIAERGRTGS